jgi:hypothetical protein
MFDSYVGLGVDCEVVVQLRRLTGNEQANVFDWQWVEHESLVHVLRTNFADYFRLPNLVLSEDHRNVVDTATGLSFHHLFTPDPDGTIPQSRLAREYPRLRARTEHLLRRWQRTADSPCAALYVRRDPYEFFTADQLVQLRDVMRQRFPAHRFALLWVRDAAAPGVEALGGGVAELAKGVYVAGLPVVEPRHENWQGDDAAWDRLFPDLRQLRPL